MTKKLSLLSLALAVCSIAYAQQKPAKTWWEQIRESTRSADAQQTQKVQQAQEVQQVQQTQQAQEADTAPRADTLKRADTLRMALILPFNTKGTPDKVSFSIYSGALCALERGLSVKLDVVDCTQDGLLSCLEDDIIIGPLSNSDIGRAASLLPRGRFIVSPLEQGVAPMADSLAVIQAPTPWEAQISDLTLWACSEMAPYDSLVIVKEKNTVSQAYDAIRRDIGEIGAPCVIITCESAENVLEIIGRYTSPAGTTRIVIASEQEQFVKRILDVAASISKEGRKVATYCPSKVRSFYSVSKEILCEASAGTVSAYFFDETSAEALDFSARYRELFKVKPSQFAYQGYDIVSCFTELFRIYGRDWASHIGEFRMDGIHMSFAFRRSEGGQGFVNHGVRRIRYKDGTAVLDRPEADPK